MGSKELKLLSPRSQSVRRNSASPTLSVSLVVTQGEHQKAKISTPPIIQKKLSSTFESNIGLEDLSEDTLSQVPLQQEFIRRKISIPTATQVG